MTIATTHYFNKVHLICSTMEKCGVCNESYEKKSPKCHILLPCDHSVCLSCLRQDSECGYIKCPFCKTAHVTTGHVENFPINRQSIKSMEDSMEIYTLPSSGEALKNQEAKTYQQNGHSWWCTTELP